MTSATNSVVVTTLVAVDPATAFEVFTEKIDGWWRRDHRYRNNPEGSMAFETDGDGRQLVVHETPGGEGHVLGRVLAWEPGKRLAFEWRPSNFAPDEVTEVEVKFEREGDRTRVTLEHRGFDALREGHPVKHGLEGPDFVSMMGVWWADLLVAHRAHTEDATR